MLSRDLSRGLFLGRMSGILFMQLCRCDCFTPRGGGHRDRRRTLREPSSYLSDTSQPPPNHASVVQVVRCGGDITANREGG